MADVIIEGLTDAEVTGAEGIIDGCLDALACR